MFYEMFEKLCFQAGKTPAEVARDIGLKSTGTASAWKRGVMPRANVIAKLAKYFNVSAQYLLTGQEIESEAPAVSDGRAVNDADIMAAFWGGDADLSGEDIAELWADAREYIAFKTAQLKKRKKNGGA